MSIKSSSAAGKPEKSSSNVTVDSNWASNDSHLNLKWTTRKKARQMAAAAQKKSFTTAQKIRETAVVLQKSSWKPSFYSRKINENPQKVWFAGLLELKCQDWSESTNWWKGEQSGPSILSALTFSVLPKVLFYFTAKNQILLLKFLKNTDK